MKWLLLLFLSLTATAADVVKNGATIYVTGTTIAPVQTMNFPNAGNISFGALKDGDKSLGAVMVIHADGTLTFNPDLKPDAAAREVIEILVKTFPGAWKAQCAAAKSTGEPHG